ncbi:MAG: redoxin domain-containing protein [Verrucomicrobiales bacterium]|nr:redoxin domain-containing protein [Verrucomicrobiales bacterium]
MQNHELKASRFQHSLSDHARTAFTRVALAGILFSFVGAAEREPEEQTRPATAPTAPADVTDLAGRQADPFQRKAKVTVLIFVNPECPISNRYAPEIQRLAKTFQPNDTSFWLVYPDPDLSVEVIQQHLNQYGLSLPALRDPRHVLVKRSQARVTPEAAVFRADSRLVYHGRIDDRYVDLGKERFAPTERDLELAVKACLANKAVHRPATKAIGCYIPE